MKNLILGSTSPARKELLTRLHLPFSVIAPNIEENLHPNESAYDMAKRLAVAKAHAVATQVTEGLIISCDQVLCLDTGEIFGKPGDHLRAIAQLKKMSGQQVISWTGLCLMNATNQQIQVTVERFDIYFRPLTTAMIENYLQMDQPYACAGSIRAEGLGIVLFERLAGDDVTALIGLPLIKLVRFLENEGVRIV